MATKKIKRFQEGGMSDKDRGLEASKDEKVGFFERLRMGNIDDEGSEAYRRFGAGRGRNSFENTPAKEPAQYRSDPYGDMTQAERDARPSSEEIQAKKRGVEQGKLQPSGDASVAEMYQGPRTSPVVASSSASSKPVPTKSAPAKAAAAKPADSKPAATSVSASNPNYSNEGRGRAAPPSNLNYSNEGRGREMTKKQQLEREIDSIKPTAEQTQKGLESASLPGAGLKALSAAAKKLAAKKATKLKDYNQPALPAPTKQLGFDKRSAFEKKRAERAAKRRDEMLDENAKNYGLDPKAPGYEAASSAVRKELGGKDFAFKKGGKVKPMAKKMASGGSTSPASKRADGIATRGKTRCKIR